MIAMLTENVWAVCILRKQGSGVTDVTNGSSEQMKAGTELTRTCEIWAFLNQGQAAYGPTTTANMYCLDTMALTEKQQEKVQVCENNLVRRIVGLKELIREEWRN